MDEVYALIDKDRAAAAEAARMKFRGDVESAITAVTEISTVAGARIASNSQVASAKILIDAEVSATRLLAEAEVRAAQCVSESLKKPKEFVESMLLEISRATSEHLTAAASDSVVAIRRDAQLAIEDLRKAGAAAILEMQGLASRVEAQLVADAKSAEERLRKFRERPHTAEEAETEADHACKLVAEAASEGAASLRETVNRSFAAINKITDDACAAIQNAALAAEERLAQAQARALVRLDEVITLNRKAAT